MVNVPDRQACVAALRRFAAGLSTVEEFENAVEELDDDAAQAFFLYAWQHYDDFKTERLVGRWRLNGVARREWARWALYLATNEEPYPWRIEPNRAWAEWIPFGGLLRLFRRGMPAPNYEPTGCFTKHWPFRDRAHLRRAERHYLASFASRRNAQLQLP